MGGMPDCESTGNVCNFGSFSIYFDWNRDSACGNMVGRCSRFGRWMVFLCDRGDSRILGECDVALIRNSALWTFFIGIFFLGKDSSKGGCGKDDDSLSSVCSNSGDLADCRENIVNISTIQENQPVNSHIERKIRIERKFFYNLKVGVNEK